MYSGAAGVGENLYAVYHQNVTMAEAARVWESTKSNKLSHYTAMVGKDSKQVGCAMAQGQDCSIIVCQYYPRGNIVEQDVF